MTSLLLFTDYLGGVHYVPTNRIVNVVRTTSNQCNIYTNIVTVDDATNPEVIAFKVRELSVGGGAADTTQVQAIYDAWEKALQNKGAVIEVTLPFTITSAQMDSVVWP
jgi:hypothetical protein